MNNYLILQISVIGHSNDVQFHWLLSIGLKITAELQNIENYIFFYMMHGNADHSSDAAAVENFDPFDLELGDGPGITSPEEDVDGGASRQCLHNNIMIRKRVTDVRRPPVLNCFGAKNQILASY